VHGDQDKDGKVVERELIHRLLVQLLQSHCGRGAVSSKALSSQSAVVRFFRALQQTFNSHMKGISPCHSFALAFPNPPRQKT
jgi:hypothetical protein